MRFSWLILGERNSVVPWLIDGDVTRLSVLMGQIARGEVRNAGIVG